ncbi:hypothetical protein [Belliella baltica]|uniref:hypothetical protein n=1 Tax=Belliella baltica TaxID=232259 RepID=UPI0002F788CD|nr:hypothetical protein [Belliella baltica]
MKKFDPLRVVNYGNGIYISTTGSTGGYSRLKPFRLQQRPSKTQYIYQLAN